MSEIVLPLNTVEKTQMEVLPEHSAAHIGSGSVAVLSTPMMILYMEKTARIWLQTYLKNGLTSVGTKVCIEHLAGVKVGETVETRIWVTEQDRRRVVFAVEVWHNDRQIGKGTHERFIVDELKFLSRI